MCVHVYRYTHACGSPVNREMKLVDDRASVQSGAGDAMGVSDEAGVAAEKAFILNAECVVTLLEGITLVVGQRVPPRQALGADGFVGGGDFPLLSGCMETFNTARSTEACALRCCLGKFRHPDFRQFT